MPADTSTALTESEFYALAKKTYERIEAAFDEVDPDEVECEAAMDTITFVLPDGAKWIVSRQPPVRQLWLAVASRGRAFHYTYDAATGSWVDAKGETPDLLSTLSQFLKEDAGLELHF